MVLSLGVKTDPIEYRYSYPWLFGLLAEEGVEHVQLGTFHELYTLPDRWFQRLRTQAEGAGLRISSVFTAHRELGGFFTDDEDWVAAARRGFDRLIEVAALVGARTAGHNPGSVLRDRMGGKGRGLRTYVAHMTELMRLARVRGLEALCIEPMSALAEPPTLPQEITTLLGELEAVHRAAPDSTCAVGCCADTAHGYADCERAVRWDNMQLLEASLPYLREVHLSNLLARQKEGQ